MSEQAPSPVAEVADESLTHMRLETDRIVLRPPRAYHVIAGHERLLASRPDPAESPVVTVIAPAGYGKSTILAEWANHDPGRVIWATLDTHDDDPATLVALLASAVMESGISAPALEEGLRAPAPSVWSRVMPRLSATLHDAAPFTLMFDDVHLVTKAASWDVIDWLALHVPEHAQVVIAGRALGGSAMPRLQVSGQLATLGTSDLALSDTEAHELLVGIRPTISPLDAARLNRSCGGWVSGLLMGGATPASLAHDGADPASREDLIDRYVEAEVLGPLDPADQEFMLQASVLRVASGPLCDEVLRRSGSHEVLARLCSSNVFVSTVGDGWCQTHELVRSALLRKEEERHPEVVALLRGRAAAWHAEHGDPAEAVQYSMDSGQYERTVDLIGRFVVQLHGSGRWAIVNKWLEWVESTGLELRNQSVTTAASVASALFGEPERSERWAAVSQRPRRGQGGPDEGHRSLVAAWQCQRGTETMLTDALRAAELVPEESHWRKSALAALAVAQLMRGLDAESEVSFKRVVYEAGPAWVDTNARSGAMAFLAILALRRQRLGEASELIERAAGLRRESGITEQALSALTDALAARVTLLREGGVGEARASLAHAQQVRALATWAVPGLALTIRIELIKSSLALGDVAGARLLTREAADILRRRPGLGTFEAEADELRARVADLAESAQGPGSLTAAELRLVPWLATHLSFREIGERLFLSPNTVKTEALSTYRKLGASSRSEAVEAAVHVGLLDPASLPGILAATSWADRSPR